MRCSCPTRAAWRVAVRNGNYSAFNGYRRAWSDYSSLLCEKEHGGCGAAWRTKAKYVESVRDSALYGEAKLQRRTTGARGHKDATTATLPGVPSSPAPRLVCEDCGQPGGPYVGPLTARFYNALGRDKIMHRDGCPVGP